MSKIHVLRRGEGGGVLRCVAGLALVGEVVPRIVRAAREYQLMIETNFGLRHLHFNRVVAARAVAPKLEQS